MTPIINRIAGIWFDWQWAMLWQTALLIGLVAAIDRLIRRWAWPQLRYTLWLLVFVKLVLPPGLASPLSVTSQVPVLAHKALETEMPAAAGPSSIEPTAAAAAPPVGENPVAASPAQIVPAPSQAVHRQSAPLSWTAYAMAVWLCGVIVLAAGLSVRLRCLAMERGAPHPPDLPAWFDDLLTQTARELGLRRLPRVVFSDKVCCPAVFGLFRPILLFPTGHLPATRQETRHILLHELAHIQRGDLLVHAVYMILATVYWFNPLLWLIRKHIQNLRELCCDATVAAHLREETAAYRETLLTTGRALLARPVDPGLGLLGLFENSGWLPIRLQWLQKRTWRYPWLRRASVAAVALLMLCCILPMASIHAAAEKTSVQPFKVTLPNGGTIALIGVRKAGTDRWWRPDGSPLAAPPYGSPEGPSRFDGYEMALLYENLPPGSTGGIDIEHHAWGGTIPRDHTLLHKAGAPVEGVTYAFIAPLKGTQTTTVKVYLATRNWALDGPDAVYWRSGGDWGSDTGSSPALGGVAFAVPYERDGRTFATLFYTALDPHNCDVRLTALDLSGVEHPPAFVGGGWTSAGLSSCVPEFDVPLEDIAAFHRQTRPYTWIEFRSVSLLPDKLQKVEIVTTEPNQPATVKKKIRVPEGFTSWRDCSAQQLQGFHTACVRYLNEHPGSELPKKPWLLKYRFPNPVFFGGRYQDLYVGYLQYVAHAGYFLPDGFPSLRRADFESSQAKRTPILYCKSLLEQEDGQGTNVLFGDGHVEYIAAEELDKLKAASAPSEDKTR